MDKSNPFAELVGYRVEITGKEHPWKGHVGTVLKTVPTLFGRFGYGCIIEIDNQGGTRSGCTDISQLTVLE